MNTEEKAGDTASKKLKLDGAAQNGPAVSDADALLKVMLAYTIPCIDSMTEQHIHAPSTHCSA